MIQLRYFIFSLLCCSIAFSTLQSQDYKSAIGLRLGYPASVSYKTFIDQSNNAWEFFVNVRTQKVSGYNWTRMGLGAAYQVHNDIQSVDGLQWYYGLGASVYLWSFDKDYDKFRNQSRTSIGLQGYLGLDYKFANAPFNLSLDWVPTFSSTAMAMVSAATMVHSPSGTL